MKVKVNVWQVGYTTQKDYVLRKNAQCRNMGYVEIPNDMEDWEEEVWILLNWSCWTNKKPKNVHSPLDHCNSDIILQIDGSCKYRYAKFVSFGDAHTLADAIQEVKHQNLWPFSDMRSAFRSGFTKTDYDGKAYWISIEDYKAGNRNWTEITW